MPLFEVIEFSKTCSARESYKGFELQFSYLLLFLIIPVTLLAQSPNPLDQIKQDVAKYRQRVEVEIECDSIRKMFFSERAYNKYFDRYFTLLNYERESFTDGNSASLKTTNEQTKLSVTASHKSRRKSILSLNVGLNIKDNSGMLFTNEKPTDGTQIAINHSQILENHQKWLKYDTRSQDANYEARRAVIDSLYYVHAYKRQIIADSVRQRLNDVNASIKVITAHDPVRDGDKQKLLKLIAEREKLVSAVESFRITKDPAELMMDIQKAAEEASVKKELATEGVMEFMLAWITTGMSYQRSNYKTYDGNLPVAHRIGETPFDGIGFSLAYNLYWQRNPNWIEFRNTKGLNSLYVAATFTLSRTNNYALIDEQNLEISNSYTQGDTVYQFTRPQKLRDITGKGFDSYLLQRIGLQFTGMIGKQQFFGVNLVPGIEWSEKTPVKVNSRVGALFKFKDSADQKAKVNFELFLLLEDWTDSMGTDKSVWKRKSIGISTSVPLKKVFFK